MKTFGKILLVFLNVCFLLTSLIIGQPVIFEAQKLKNGLNIYYQKEAELKITTIFFLFPGGQRLEPENKAGLSYLTTRLMAEIPDEDKLSELVAAGVNLSAGTRADFSFIQLDCLSPNLEKALKIISSSLRDPIFSGPRIEAVKKSLLSESGKESCRLIDSAKICLRQQLFPDSPYSLSLFGTETSLKTISKKDITKFYEKIFQPDNLSLVIISDLEKEIINTLIIKYFSGIKKPTRRLELPAIAREVPDVRAGTRLNCDHYQGPSGAAVIVGYVFPGSVSEIYPQAYLIEKIIGEGPGSALWHLRQESTLAYNLNSQLEVIGNKVILVAYLETESRSASSALESLKALFNRLSQNGFEAHEIETGKLLARSSYFRESFSRDTRINRLALFLANNLPVDFYNQFLQTVDNLPPSALNNLVRSTFRPEAAVEIVVSKD